LADLKAEIEALAAEPEPDRATRRLLAAWVPEYHI